MSLLDVEVLYTNMQFLVIWSAPKFDLMCEYI